MHVSEESSILLKSTLSAKPALEALLSKAILVRHFLEDANEQHELTGTQSGRHPLAYNKTSAGHKLTGPLPLRVTIAVETGLLIAASRPFAERALILTEVLDRESPAMTLLPINRGVLKLVRCLCGKQELV